MKRFIRARIIAGCDDSMANFRKHNVFWRALLPLIHYSGGAGTATESMAMGEP
jgi:hypothetical protein